jgi:hypothetical protein
MTTLPSLSQDSRQRQQQIKTAGKHAKEHRLAAGKSNRVK